MIGFRNLLLAVSICGLSVAQAQQYPTVPDNSVVGRIGTGSGAGPAQAIPFSALNGKILNSLCQTDRAFPVYNAASVAWVCSTAPAANRFYAGPAPLRSRALVGADRPLPAASTLGSVMSKAAVASNWLRSIGTDGIPTASQPNFSEIGGISSLTAKGSPASADYVLLSDQSAGGALKKATVSSLSTAPSYIGFITGLQPLKLGGAVVGVNPDAWSDPSHSPTTKPQLLHFWSRLAFVRPRAMELRSAQRSARSQLDRAVSEFP